MKKIVTVAMPGCGNCGDDLISELLQEHIHDLYPNSQNYILGLDDSIFDIKYNNQLILYPQNRPFKFLGRLFRIVKAIKDCDIMYVGGGGLLQDTHSFFTPHHFLHWTSYAKCPICLVGLGVGPVKSSFNKWYIKKMLNKKGLCIQVRDIESKKRLLEYGVKNEIYVGCDIVEGSNLNNLQRKDNNYTTLGCSIRPWSDVDYLTMAKIIDTVCESHNINKVTFFVFEYDKNDRSELLFLEHIQKHIKSKDSTIVVYGRDDSFYNDLCNVDYAIASRYHANVLWQKMNIPVIPIPYAPKVYSLYCKHGINLCNTLEISGHSMFQKISISDEYNLPSSTIQCHYNLPMQLLNYTMGIVSVFCSIWKSINARLFNNINV